MIRYRWYKRGKLFAMRYEFETAGDTLPAHVHALELHHNVIVLRGAIAFAIAGTVMRVPAGEVVDFANDMPHSIEALQDGTTLINFFLHGMPADYAGLPKSEWQGTIP